MKFEVTCLDPKTGRRISLGRANDAQGVETLFESGKARGLGYRDYQTMPIDENQQDLFSDNGDAAP